MDSIEIIIKFHELLQDGRVPLTITTVSGRDVKSSLFLPFTADFISTILRALDARQYPDYPIRERFFKSDDDRALIIKQMRSLGLWEENSEIVPIDIHTRVGRMLGSILFTEIAKDCLIIFYKNITRQTNSHVIFAFDTNAWSLACLPWELSRVDNQPFLLYQGIPLGCSRTIPLERPTPHIQQNSMGIRILVLAPEAGFSHPLQREYEQRARDSLKQELQHVPVHVEYLSPVTMESLYERLDQGPTVDVLDYYGHGRFKNGSGALLLDGADGNVDEWVNASRFANLPNLPRLVVLCACQSAQNDMIDPIAGTATALSFAGVQAVVAMQLTTRMTAATNFITPYLYRYLAAGMSIQQSVAKVRQVLFATEPDGASWYLPAVYLRMNNFSPIYLIEKSRLPPNPFAGAGALGNSAQIIGREKEQRRLWERLRSGGNLTVVGPPDSGKTTLLHSVNNNAKNHFSSNVHVVELTIRHGLRRIDVERELTSMIVGLTGGDKKKQLRQIVRGLHIIILLNDIAELDRGEIGRDVRQFLRDLSQNRTNNTLIQLVASSIHPLHEVFINDSPVYSSPFHEVMRDIIELRPFSEIDARRFIATQIQNTPFEESDFGEALTKPLNPGEIKKICLRIYDELRQNWEDDTAI